MLKNNVVWKFQFVKGFWRESWPSNVVVWLLRAPQRVPRNCPVARIFLRRHGETRRPSCDTKRMPTFVVPRKFVYTKRSWQGNLLRAPALPVGRASFKEASLDRQGEGSEKFGRFAGDVNGLWPICGVNGVAQPVKNCAPRCPIASVTASGLHTPSFNIHQLSLAELRRRNKRCKRKHLAAQGAPIFGSIIRGEAARHL